jgi:Tetracyclin repressor-like, C-terminal domain
LGSRKDSAKAATKRPAEISAVRVIAVDDVCPWSSSEKKIVARTATPIELPSCWIAFRVPEAEPTDPARWREQLQALVVRMVRMMAVEYPGMARLAMARIPVGDNALRVTESMLSLLKAGGVSDQAAAYAADLINMHATAIGYEQSLYAALYDDPEHEAREIERIAARFASLPPERFPTMASLQRDMTRGDGEERFALGLDVIVNGLLATPTEGRLTRGFAGEEE